MAPSITRWSRLRVAAISQPTTSWWLRTTGCSIAAPQARIALLGGLMMAVKLSTPNMPRFEMVKVAPDISSMERPLVRAFSPSARTSPEICRRLFRLASLTTPTTRPPPFSSGSAIATPTFTCWWTRMRSPAQLALKKGFFAIASAQARMMKSLTLSFTSMADSCSFSEPRSARMESIENFIVTW